MKSTKSCDATSYIFPSYRMQELIRNEILTKFRDVGCPCFSSHRCNGSGKEIRTKRCGSPSSRSYDVMDQENEIQSRNKPGHNNQPHFPPTG
ncbi:hypothetical protein AVEN_158206-1 [Araneus ventricosus]|uniref:Uncharacterized protein n=1 Tax=Araneus ventricosus TaxID=182803 RepID=A0A4Y2WLJ4_ARAVE|nr:hypothetical protein AVEN_158206-1 [Araneus ventricosus]